MTFSSAVSGAAVRAESPAPQAAPAAEPWNAPAFSVDAKAVYQAASASSAPDGTDVSVFTDDESYRFDDAGRMVHVGHIVFKVLTQKGAEGWDSLAVGWEPWHEARPAIRARVIAPDFSVHTLDPKTVTEAPARGGDYKIYSDGKRLHAPLPAIAPGVVVEEEYTETETEPLFAAGRVGRVILGRENVPVAHVHVVFDAPDALPLRTQLQMLPGVKPIRIERGGRVTLTYDAGPLAPIDDVEPYLPPDAVRYPMIAFSTGASWQSVATEYGKIVDARANSPAVRALVGPLLAGKQTVEEKEAALTGFLDRSIRYTGIEFGEAAIVPHDPAETLAEKYGDCKDKATLLVAMLRAAGIPAYVALLNVESPMDVPPDLPGMGLFNHAIVYVPGQAQAQAQSADKVSSAGALWIDATDQFAPLGQLPMPDQGRLALVTSRATTALVRTPVAPASANGMTETREFTLADNGPAKVVEITEPRGIFASSFRGYYADKPDKDARENLLDYMKSEYLCEDLTSVDRSDATDLSKPFQLTITCDKAKRGYTDLESAQVAIRLNRLFEFLPPELRRREDASAKKTSGLDKPKKPRTADWWLNVAFTNEWNYRIAPPAGFIPKELPKDTSLALGPARLTETYSADTDGVVHARLVFASVKRRYTVAEATALRNQVADLIDGPAIVVDFEPKGALLLREGKVKEALASYRALIAANPKAAVHHLQVAEVLLQAGMGGAARDEARLAVQLDPKSALAEKTLAEILKHDIVGRELRAGSDLPGAAAAYRAAIQLDPDDDSTKADLAILLEYDPVGRRYGSQAHMKEAVAEYETIGQNKLADLGLTSNLAFALFYSGDFAGAYKAAQALDAPPRPLMAAAMAMLQGSKAGLAEANRGAIDDAGFKQTARIAGQMLMNMRQYPQAADFFQAGAGGDDAARTLSLANMLRSARHHEDVHFANTPADVVKRFVLIPFDPNLTRESFAALLSRNGLKVLNAMDADALQDTLASGRKMNRQLARTGSSLNVTEDLVLQALDPKGEGDDANGYRERVQTLGGNTLTIYIVQENGQYKLLDTEEQPNALALEMLDRITAGNLRGAKVLLDWLREDVHLEGGDDPLGGPVFPRFWTRGEAPDAHRMKLAAAAILAGSKPTAAEGVSILQKALRTATSDRERTNIRLALTAGYAMQRNYAGLLAVSSALLKEEPESRTAFIDNVLALMGLDRYAQAQALADARLKLIENDTDALQMKIQVEANRGDFAAARALTQKLAGMGKEDAMMLNNEAWYALFSGKVSQDDIAIAIRATELGKDAPSILHTLACLYAEVGNTRDARAVLLRAMDLWNLGAPNDEVWYVLGRIAEQYGERTIAIADYGKLTRPKDPIALPTSTWKLAQIRLKAMGAQTASGPAQKAK